MRVCMYYTLVRPYHFFYFAVIFSKSISFTEKQNSIEGLFIVFRISKGEKIAHLNKLPLVRWIFYRSASLLLNHLINFAIINVDEVHTRWQTLYINV